MDKNNDTAMRNGLTAAQTLAAALSRHGVQAVFGQSIPTSVILASEDCGIRQITYRTENAGAAMADGFARVSGRIGVVAAQNGPAATLLVAGLAEALKSSVPVLALVQDISRPLTDRNAFQDFDHIALFQACSKWVRRVGDASRIDDYVDMAITVATSGRPGPAVLLLPMDMLVDDVVQPSGRTSRLGQYPLDRMVPQVSQIKAAAALINSAVRPLIVAGGGVHLSGAAAELAALQEAAGVPVATTVMGKGGVDEIHPLSIGVIGNNMGQEARTHGAREYIAAADVVVLVGTRTAQNGTDSWALLPKQATYIHIDIDGLEVGRNYESTRLVGDAKATLQALVGMVASDPMRRARAEAMVAASRAACRVIADVAPRITRGAIRPQALMADLQTCLTADTIVVADASYASVWISTYLQSLAAGMRFITPRGLAGLGWGLPLALGAKLARPTSPVVCVVGDGGFGHVWSELETARRSDLPITIIVLNNGILAFQKDTEDLKFGRHTSAVQFAAVDHAAIAVACGCNGVTVRRHEDFLLALRSAQQATMTTVLDVITDPDTFPAMTLFDDRLAQARSRIATAVAV